MDKVAHYKAIARQVVEEIAALDPSTDTVDSELIIDDERGHYLLFLVGWQRQHWQYGSLVHLDVKPNGKIWLQHDGTDLPVAEWLLARGVPKSDIVLGFHAPQQRQTQTEWAVE